MNLPRILVDELESILDRLPASSPDDLLAVVQAAAEAQRLKDEQCLREQKPAAYCRPDDPQNSTAFAWPGTDREEGHLAPLYAAPVPASQGDGWLPIETAPKDGAWFIALSSADGRRRMVRWADWGWDRYPINDEERVWGSAPDLWQPLPAAPVTTKEA